MNRRQIVKGMAATVGGMLVLPAWASAWNTASLQGFQSKLSLADQALLAEIVEAIIPETDTPGAKKLEVHRFVDKIITDCYDQKSRAAYLKGLSAVETMATQSYAKPYASCTPAQRLEVLTTMSKSADADEQNFIRMARSLTIRGYLSSEYVMTKLMGYEMAPGRYYGCVPVKA
ncbi:gluconate 2-dehydrogenase subunit 3 family protein [Haliscomenobacter sp.]|uniref:gluconate 2-dehydrogenase subunit 3 family protein n=1 Tax=Haliscomenobacter sp. TaxID=2717303 RepID=UPI003364B4E8